MHTFYKVEILDHFKHPQNFGTLLLYTKSAKQTNPFCGDDIEIFVNIVADRICDISFAGRGCAISIAGASLLTEEIKGKPLEIAKKFTQNNMLDLLGMDVSETRKKCALLSLAVLQDCLV